MDLAIMELELHLHRPNPADAMLYMWVKPFASGAGLCGSQGEVLPSVLECRLRVARDKI